MSYSVIPTPVFKKLFRKLLKKYPSLKTEVQALINILKKEPELGIPLGQGIHKIRLAIASKGKGKAGGARVITYFVSEDNEVYLLFIYDKSQLENITPQQIVDLLNKAGIIK